MYGLRVVVAMMAAISSEARPGSDRWLFAHRVCALQRKEEERKKKNKGRRKKKNKKRK